MKYFFSWFVLVQFFLNIFNQFATVSSGDRSKTLANSLKLKRRKKIRPPAPVQVNLKSILPSRIFFPPEAVGGGVSDECFLSRSGVSRNVGELLGESDMVIVVLALVVIALDALPSPDDDELEPRPRSVASEVFADSVSLEKQSGRCYRNCGLRKCW